MKKTIGLVGGAGPIAGSLVLKKLIAHCQLQYGCIHDEDFPKLILVSVPFAEMLQPSRQQQEETKVTLQLQETLDFLISSGCDSVAIACNTLHAYLDEGCYRDKLVHLVVETESYILEQPFSRVLVLCTETSVQKEVYNFCSMLLPNKKEQQFINEIINRVLSGKLSQEDSLELEEFALSKIEEDEEIDGILLGCTELSVLQDTFPMERLGMPLIDPVDILIHKLMAN